MNNCVSSSIQAYQPGPDGWTKRHIAHIYRTLGYGASFAELEAGLSLDPQTLVHNLLDAGAQSEQPVPYYWVDYTREDYDGDGDLEREHFREIKRDWIRRGFSHPFQHRMVMFWHSHFATEVRVYGCNSYVWDYYKLLHEEAFGNFRRFVERMGLTEAMLVYLDGNLNRVGQPNENYARELMELFTMGENNGYTQQDIVEVSKALTGYRVRRYLCEDAEFFNSRYDDSVKTIFGQSGNFNYDDVHELIFTLKRNEVAHHICSRIYQHFIYKDVNQEVVSQLAEVFLQENWELLPVLKKLFASEHFFEMAFQGAKIKSPMDLLIQQISSCQVDMEAHMESDTIAYIDYISEQMGQEIFNPPNVAGWPGHRFWLSENALAFRWSYCHNVLNNYFNEAGHERIRDLVLEISPSENDPKIITAAMAEYWLGLELEEDLIDVGVQFLKAGIPENYFDDGTWSLYWPEAPQQVVNLFKYFIQLPEYQLT